MARNIRQVQQWLKDHGYNPGPIDGINGPKTKAAVRAFQTAAGIQVDGIAGPQTNGAMDSWGGGGGGGKTAAPVPDPETPAEFTDEDPAGDAEGASTVGNVTYAGVLQGGELTRIVREGADDLWMMMYQFPEGSGEYVSWQFDSEEQLAQVFGPEWWLTMPPRTETEAFLTESVDVMASADEITGLSGTFMGLMDDAGAEAARIAGIDDPTILGQIVGNSEWQDITKKAALGNWTEAQTMAELRQTDLWTQTLYPGIESLYGQTDEPEQLWGQYLGTVENSLTSLGIARDPDGSYRQVIGEMLADGVDDNLFVQSTPTFIRAEQSTGFRDALNTWTERVLGTSLEFGDMFDVIGGEGNPDVLAALELAQLQFAADNAGVAVAAEQLQQIGADANLTEEQAVSAFSEVERNLLAIDSDRLGQFGLSQADLIAASAGISTPSGRSIEEVRSQARVAAQEMGMVDDVAPAIFVGFSERGTPERPGLSPLAPEGA